jgi:hypothetical protein
VIVGTCTCPSVAARPSSQRTPTSPRAFGIRHDVRLRHWHEVLGAEELAHFYLMPDRLLRRRTKPAGQHILLFIVQFHGSVY